MVELWFGVFFSPRSDDFKCGFLECHFYKDFLNVLKDHFEVGTGELWRTDTATQQSSFFAVEDWEKRDTGPVIPWVKPWWFQPLPADLVSLAFGIYRHELTKMDDIYTYRPTNCM